MERKSSLLYFLVLILTGLYPGESRSMVPDTLQIDRYYEHIIKYKQANGANKTYYSKLDTLKSRLDNAAEDELCSVEYLTGLNFYAKEISLVYPDSAMHMLRKVVGMSRNCNEPRAEAGALHELGVLYASHGLMNIALDYFLQSLSMFGSQDDWLGYGYAFVDIGNIYFSLNKLDKARDKYVEAEQIFLKGEGVVDERDLQYALAVCRNNIGLVELEKGNGEIALELFREAYKIRRDADFFMYLPHSSLYISRALDSLGYEDSARLEIYRALELDSIRNGGVNEGLLTLYLGGLFMKNDLSKAQKYFRDAFRIATEMEDYSLLQQSIRGIALCFEDTNPDSSLHYFTRVYEIAEEQNNFGLREEIAEKLAHLYELNQDFEKQNYYLQILNTILKQKLNESVLKSELKIEEQNWQTERLSFLERIRRQNVVTWALIILALLIIAFTIVVITNRLRIKRKSRELHILNQELQRIIKHRDKIYGIIAHDLRGPIGTSKQLLDVIQDPKLSTDQKDRFIEAVRDSMGVSYGLLDNLLNWANLKVGNLHLEPAMHEVKDMVDEQVRVYEDLIKEKSLRLENNIAAGQYAYFDKRTISTVIRNLLSNAIKFSNEGGAIRIGTDLRDGYVSIYVEDNGIGMRGEEITRVMSDEDFLTRQGTKNEGGSGLGLKVCKEFMEKNQGRLEVFSEKSRGTRFVAWLPATPPRD